MTDPPYALWSIWKDLGVLYKAFFVLLGVVAVYSVVTAARIAIRVRSIRCSSSANAAAAKKSLTALGDRWTNVRHLTLTTFYLFGFVLFIGLQTVGQTVDRSQGFPGRVILADFLFQCAFASNVFFILLILQLVQWAVGATLKSTAQRLDAAS